MQGIIFDFNGTLLFDSQLHYDAWKLFSKKLRGYEFSDTEMREKMFGRRNADIIEYALGYTPSEEEITRLAYEKEEMYRQMCLKNRKEFVLAPYAEDFLDYLKEKNIPRTIATMSEWDNVEFYIKEFKLERWFDLDKIVYSDGKIAGKPAPDIYLIAAKNIGIAPENCVVIEDSLAGLESANNANIGHIIAIATLENDSFYSQIPYVKGIIHNYKDVFNYIKF